MDQINNQRYYSLWIGLSLVLFISVSLYFEVFNRFDRLIYDQATIASSFYQSHPSQVLLIEVDVDENLKGLSVDKWFSLLEQIQQHQPAAIAINLLPWSWADKDINNAAERFSLTIGNPARAKADLYKNIELSVAPPIEINVFRQQRYHYYLNDKLYPALETVVTTRVKPALKIQQPVFKNNDSENKYYINFLGGAGRLPVLSSQRVIDGGLISALVKDKVVLIGVKPPMSLDLQSPIGMMPYANYQAFAIDTILTGSSIKVASIWVILVSVVLLVLVLFIAALKVPDRYQLFLILIVSVGTLTLSYGSLLIFNYWILPGYLLITIFSILIALLYLRNRQNHQALQSMTVSSAAKIETHWLSEDFYSSAAHWNHIANMVTQTLSLERTIFLERIENDHRVREIKALNCSLDDVGEMRRDYQRTPYTTAIEYGGALKLSRPYLEGTADDEIQYLMPLTFAGNIQGFWAFTIKADAQIEEEKLVDAVEQFAIQISELLYHWSEWGKSQKIQSSFMVNFLQMKFEKNSYDSINHSINFLTHRITVMETVMDGLETLAILYDLFGRVVHVNKSMTDMLTEINLMPYSMTTVDLIVNLSSCTMTEARNYLSYLVLEQGTITLPVVNDGVKTGYMMVVSALKNDKDHENAEGEIVPFEMIGILCELIDMSQIRELYSQKEKIIQYMSGWLRNDLSSISMACDLAQDKRLSDEKHKELMQLIKTKVNQLSDNFKQVNSVVQQDLVTKVASQYPVDYIESLQLAIVESTGKSNKSIKIEPVTPFFSPLVMASPKELRHVFGAIVSILINDALEDSEIIVEITCKDNQVFFKFSNTGFGIPEEQLQQYMQSKEELVSDDFKNLRLASDQIVSWGEVFHANSKIGEGMSIEFTLKAFSI